MISVSISWRVLCVPAPSRDAHKIACKAGGAKAMLKGLMTASKNENHKGKAAFFKA